MEGHFPLRDNSMIPAGMTGSAFLALTRRLAVKSHRGGTLTALEESQISRAIDAVGPEYFYMDGELFA